jgi:hypothetical protein
MAAGGVSDAPDAVPDAPGAVPDDPVGASDVGTRTTARATRAGSSSGDDPPRAGLDTAGRSSATGDSFAAGESGFAVAA